MDDGWVTVDEAEQRVRRRLSLIGTDAHKLMMAAIDAGKLPAKRKATPGKLVDTKLFDAPGLARLLDANMALLDAGGRHCWQTIVVSEVELAPLMAWIDRLEDDSKPSFLRNIGRAPVAPLPAPQLIAQPTQFSDKDGRYLSPFMQMMLRAIDHFNITETTHPKKEELEAYFLALKLPDGKPVSPNHAKYLATFCRAPDAMKGGNKRVG